MNNGHNELQDILTIFIVRSSTGVFRMAAEGAYFLSERISSKLMLLRSRLKTLEETNDFANSACCADGEIIIDSLSDVILVDDLLLGLDLDSNE